MDPFKRYVRDFRPRYIEHVEPETEPCAAPSCGAQSVDFGEPVIEGEMRVEGRAIAPIHVRRRYCAEHLA